MAAIWVVFGHSAVIPKSERWPANIESRTLGSHTRTLTTVPPPLLFKVAIVLLLLGLVAMQFYSLPSNWSSMLSVL